MRWAMIKKICWYLLIIVFVLLVGYLVLNKLSTEFNIDPINITFINSFFCR
jgi:hypothetical protein